MVNILIYFYKLGNCFVFPSIYQYTRDKKNDLLYIHKDLLLIFYLQNKFDKSFRFNIGYYNIIILITYILNHIYVNLIFVAIHFI